jgi:hypothetical protein
MPEAVSIELRFGFGLVGYFIDCPVPQSGCELGGEATRQKRNKITQSDAMGRERIILSMSVFWTVTS